MGASKQDLPEAPTEPQRVWAWRLEQFVVLGAETELACQLAESRVDVREFERLLGLGCGTELAARILL